MELLNPCKSVSMAAQSVSYTGTAGTLTGWPVGPEGVLVWCSTDAYITVGDSVVATTGSTPIPAGTPVPFRIPHNPGGVAASGTWTVSAIQISTGGTLYAKPLEN